MYRSGIGYDTHRFEEGASCPRRSRDSAHARAGRTFRRRRPVPRDRRCVVRRDRRSATSDTIFRIPTKRFAGSAVSRFCAGSEELLGEEKCRSSINIDATLIAEAPKIGPHLEAMREKISRRSEFECHAVGIKATTNEGLGALGRGEGMAALAVASVGETNRLKLVLSQVQRSRRSRKQTANAL